MCLAAVIVSLTPDMNMSNYIRSNQHRSLGSGRLPLSIRTCVFLTVLLHSIDGCERVEMVLSEHVRKAILPEPSSAIDKTRYFRIHAERAP